MSLSLEGHLGKKQTSLVQPTQFRSSPCGSTNMPVGGKGQESHATTSQLPHITAGQKLSCCHKPISGRNVETLICLYVPLLPGGRVIWTGKTVLQLPALSLSLRELSSTPGWLQLNQIFASVLALSLGCYLSYWLVAVRRPHTKETLTEERI